MEQDGAGVGTVAGAVLEHLHDQVVGFVRVVVESEDGEIRAVFFDVQVAPKAFATDIEGVMALCHDVEEDAAEGEDVDGFRGAAAGGRVDGCAL